ncbi:hypothetical protein NHX12_003515 [Muraenolepis orangiensis]|uniref:F-box domain-containing protein n=1 Tax=Muraenolepis orangiensis TaxID=630683 RepID=A0A9Q0IG97_9TELE|nr:hypothetical protein NHX12_003515 [Muraenolepis orangiensis]
MDNIPVVDFLGEKGVSDGHDVVDLARQLKSAFTEVGFVYLKNTGITQEELPTYQFEKAYSFYRIHLTRGWVEYITQRKRKAYELHQKMNLADEHDRRRCQGLALTRWMTGLAFRRSKQAAAIEKLQKVFNGIRFKHVLVLWSLAVKETKRTKEYFEKQEKAVLEMSGQIFQYLELRDLLNCELVCSTWRTIACSELLWSRVNFSVEKERITDWTVRQILRRYRPFVTNLNLRGCTSLTWHSLTCIRVGGAVTDRVGLDV